LESSFDDWVLDSTAQKTRMPTKVRISGSIIFNFIFMLIRTIL